MDTVERPPQEQTRPTPDAGYAPWWHAVVLVVFIVTLSFYQARRTTSGALHIHRMATYGVSVATEALLAAWVLFGLWLRKRRLGEVLGGFSFRPRALAADLAAAAIFWVCALFVLGSCALTWERVTARTQQNSVASAQSQRPHLSEEQTKTLETLKELAPATRGEMAAWTLLCLLVGFSEELVFRGYLQHQFAIACGGRLALGALLAAVVFGAAHAYQGVRGMVLLGVYGALFAGLAIYRRSLRAGMFAHAWHDIFTGLALAALKAHNMI